MEILEVIELKKYFHTKAEFLKKSDIVRAVDNVSFKIMEGEILGLVGESGCGKTTCGKTILKIYEPDSGKILFRGEDITNLKRNEMREYRKRMGIVYQDPFGSLDPRMTVGSIISEPMEIHNLYPKKDREEKVQEILEKVGLTSEQMNRYPHEFSGGQRQRIGIARTLAVNPEFVVADEPVSALDVSIQAQILNLMQDLQNEFGFTYLFITHDLSVIKHICDRVAVMYVGKIVEMAPKKELFKNPLHPYTEALLSAVPTVNPKLRRKEIILEGDVPSPINPPTGCRFHERCFKKIGKICETKEPELIESGKNHFVACHLY
ncbi:MAG TPA: dipeptide ABC transporter ATP-binding protein [Candidatus Methanofastidiosum sp.]|jgi:peptide/nickel transport system ATP-binding protein/oligopeptide transport system ATP-binding protein|nr:dipeptide ABC transporter ATP-binding protein [Methanofastidiosum sp.]